MSVTMHIKSSERGVIRVFHIDLPREAVERFTTQAGTGEWPLQYALGAKALRNEFVEVIDLRDLADMPLSDYLSQAHDVPVSELGAMRSRIDGLTGHALVLASQAFDQTEQELAIATPLRWIGTFNEPKPAGRGAPIRSDAAKGVGGMRPPPRPNKSTSTLVLVLAILLMIAVGVIIAKFVLF